MWTVDHWQITDSELIVIASDEVENISRQRYSFPLKQAHEEITNWNLNMVEYWDHKKQEHIQEYENPNPWLRNATWNQIEKLFNILTK